MVAAPQRSVRICQDPCHLRTSIASNINDVLAISDTEIDRYAPKSPSKTSKNIGFLGNEMGYLKPPEVPQHPSAEISSDSSGCENIPHFTTTPGWR
jgi:hypothetical protein